MYFDKRCAPITVVSLNLQSLKVPVAKMVTEEYAFILKLDGACRTFEVERSVAMFADKDDKFVDKGKESTGSG